MKKAFFCIDGFSFKRMNDYYKYEHRRHSRLKIASFDAYLRYEIERRLGIQSDSCNLSIEKHFYYPSQSPRSHLIRSEVKDAILRFETTLLKANYAIHYSKSIPLASANPNENIFTDALLAAELKEIDFFILLSTQGEHAEILRQMKRKYITSLLLGWEATCTNSFGLKRRWKIDKVLLDFASVYCSLNKMLDTKSKHPLVEAMFEKGG